MLHRWRQAGLMLPSALALVCFGVLVGLGTWQWQRWDWKTDLIAKIAARRTGEPIPYAEALSRFASAGEAEYTRVRVAGTFDHTTERHLYAPSTAAQGWNVFTLLTPSDGAPPVFVNRGWVPADRKDAATRAEGQVAGVTEVVGLVRAGEPLGLFTPAPDRPGNRYYARDLEAFRFAPDPPPTAEARSRMRLAAYAPFAIDAEAEPANPGGWPKGGTTELRISNRHLEYIVTWYGLAATLIGVFAAFAHQRLARARGGD